MMKITLQTLKDLINIPRFLQAVIPNIMLGKVSAFIVSIYVFKISTDLEAVTMKLIKH
jgi:hypothetical protein